MQALPRPARRAPGPRGAVRSVHLRIPGYDRYTTAHVHALQHVCVRTCMNMETCVESQRRAFGIHNACKGMYRTSKVF